ncbi:unnamed protein product [Linum tenue]|uniref:Uncharacterized protein n=1 Tax=Linum tenue TaxID=586396 RepID=A0AAV0QKN8_9ROSI|nr:unnamed protein product [Linum tenue]
MLTGGETKRLVDIPNPNLDSKIGIIPFGHPSSLYRKHSDRAVKQETQINLITF